MNKNPYAPPLRDGGGENLSDWTLFWRFMRIMGICFLVLILVDVVLCVQLKRTATP